MPTGPAARVTDPVMHPLPPILSPGPGSIDVFIGFLPAWRGVPAGAAAALSAAKSVSDAAIKTAEAATLAAAGTPGAPAAKAAEEATKAAAAAQMGSMITSMAGGADIHTCGTPLPIPPHGPGVIIDGSPTVLINNLPACRMGDTILEAVGPPNKPVNGCTSVIIGDSGSGGGGAGGGSGGGFTPNPPTAWDRFSDWVHNIFADENHQRFHYSDNIIIEGSPEFILKTRMALAALDATRTGDAMFEAIQNSGHDVTIVETTDANGYATPDNGADAQNGTGTGTTIEWNPDHHTTDPADPVSGTPGSTVILGHELVHATHNATGTQANGPHDSYPGQSGSSNRGEERATVGAGGTTITDPSGNTVPVPDHSNDVPTENSLRDDLGIPRRPTYYPSTWSPAPPW